MRKTTRVSPSATNHKAYTPLERSKEKDEAERLFDAYLNTFQAAPEADFLLKRYFFSMYFEKEYLQDNTFLIPRRDFLWFFTYCLDHEREARTVILKKRSTSKAETQIELVTIQMRRYYTVEEGPVDIIYTRSFEDGTGETYTLKNTVGAVSLAEKLLLDFQDDPVTAEDY
jgi:hypothetical protein